MEETERKLASIQQIAEIKPIENADAIEAVRVNGWWVVAKKSDFKVGDFCVYFEIDSWVPTDIAPFLTKNAGKPRVFNDIEGERLKTIKLRGQISQGLVLPVTQFTHFPMTEEDIGLNVTKSLRVQKWEMPISPQLAGQMKGSFPHFIRKTDEERIQNLVKEYKHAVENGETFEVTMKLDGSSTTVYFNEGAVGICSRNIELKISEENSENSFIKTATKFGMFEALEKLGRNIAIQAELMGPGVQGNRENFTEHKLFVYKIWDIDRQEYMVSSERFQVLESLAELGMTALHVPVMYMAMSLAGKSIDDILVMAEGASITNPIREGMVFKSNSTSFTFKAISNLYLLDKK